jgi:hypothetical protein
VKKALAYHRLETDEEFTKRIRERGVTRREIENLRGVDLDLWAWAWRRMQRRLIFLAA